MKTKSAVQKTRKNNEAQTPASYDILIIGAGPAGLCFARAVAPSGLRVALLEKQDEKILADPPYDGREIALTHLSRKTMIDLDLWNRIPEERISMIRHAKVLNGESSYALHFDHADTGKETLGFMISNHLIRKAAYEAMKAQGGVDLITGAEVSGITHGAAHNTVELKDGRTMTARLVVAADSRFSAARDMMGVAAERVDFKRLCVVCKMSIDREHDSTAYECFHFDRTLAVLPLNNREVSVVVTLDADKGADVMDVSPEAFAADIERRVDGKFGPMRLSTQRYPYPLVATYDKQFYAHRFALIGDAAVGMHPVTAHGFNLGIRSAQTLAQLIIERAQSGLDIGSETLLRTYNRKHRNASRPIYLGTNALVHLYTRTTPLARIARGALLRLGNRLGPAKRLISNQLTELNAVQDVRG